MFCVMLQVQARELETTKDFKASQCWLECLRSEMGYVIKLPMTVTDSVWQFRVEIKHYSIAFSTSLLCSKHCSTELLLRVVLIFAT